MANNNTGGCAGGIIQIFGGIGMLFMTCARMGDDVMRCGSAASRLDDIGRTGSRIYYPMDDAVLSTTYTRYADDALAARTRKFQDAINENAPIASSLIDAKEVIPTVTAQRPITAKPQDYVYNSLRVLNAGKDIPKMLTEEVDISDTRQQNIAKMHKRLLLKYCEDYMSGNPHFNRRDKDFIVIGIKKAGSPNFLEMKAALNKIDENVEEIEKVFDINQGYASAYKRAVIDNFLVYISLSNEAFFDFSLLPLASRDSGFAAYLELTSESKDRNNIIKNMLQQQ